MKKLSADAVFQFLTIIGLVLVSIALAFTGLQLLSLRAQNKPTQRWEKVNLRTPDFRLMDLSGSFHLSSEYANTVRVLVFWASWCRYCHEELPLVGDWMADHPDVQLIGIGYMDSPAQLRDFESKAGLKFPTLIDEDQALARALKVNVTPTFYLVDKVGRARFAYRGTGFVRSKDVEVAIEGLKRTG